MDFVEVMVNVLMGICSGVISSVIVSVCFYVITLEQNHLDEAKNMSYPLYSMLAVSLVSDMIVDKSKIDIGERLRLDLDEINNNFSQYEPWRYNGRLKMIMEKIYAFITDGRTHQAVAGKDLQSIVKEVTELKVLLEDYEKNFAKYCFFDILNNIVIKIACIIVLVLIIIFLAIIIF